MKKTKYNVKATSQFKKDYKLSAKRGLDVNLLDEVIAILAKGEKLPERNYDHALGHSWSGHGECHNRAFQGYGFFIGSISFYNESQIINPLRFSLCSVFFRN